MTRGDIQTSGPKVLLISSDTVGPSMAGTGIRYWNLARVISQTLPVTLATPVEATLAPPEGVSLRSYAGVDNDERGHNLAELIEEHDVIVAQHIPYLYTDDKVLRERFLIVDLYAPWILEKLEHARVDPEVGEPNRKDDVAILNRLLRLGDAFICASERQRDFWLGSLATAGRLDLSVAQADPSLRGLIDVVPFGLPVTPPQRNGPGPRETIDGIDDDSVVVLWNGGLWNWLDPFTAIRAMTSVVDHQPNAVLVFMGVRSPVAEIARMRVVEDARQLARDLGLLNRHVFFNDWVPYEQRQNWLLQADLSLSLHQESLESRFAFRTRMLDNIWCQLPIVATTGDVLADVVERRKIGFTVQSGDSDATTRAILAAIDPDNQKTFRTNLATLADENTWEAVSQPLVNWCHKPVKLGSRGENPNDRYVHDLERTYSETAEYARHLERVVAEKDREIQSQQLTARNIVNLANNRLRRKFRRKSRDSS